MHIPVLFEETIDALAVKAGGTYVDGTLGRAGHASEVLRRAGPDGRLLGIDRDGEALARAAEILGPVPGRKVLVHGEHGDLAAIAAANGFNAVDGILLDLGVSSDQLDTPERGFSFRADGPLDMRMDRTRGKPAAELVNDLSEEDFSGYMYSAGIPDPELLIRPGGEKRLSNFLLWQLAYTEFYCTDVLWPDFTTDELDQLIAEFKRRDRRYGGVKNP